VYLLNRSFTRSIDKMPYEAWFGKKPSAENLCVFRYVVHVKSACPFLRKLDGSTIGARQWFLSGMSQAPRHIGSMTQQHAVFTSCTTPCLMKR
jgi:hypothetical protein